MSTKEVNAAEKGRQTKLLKKTNEELITIILKKDKVEKTLQARIAALKGEVNNCTDTIAYNHKEITRLSNCVDNVRREYKEKLSDAEKIIDQNEILISNMECSIEQMTTKYNILKAVTSAIAIGFVLTLCWIFC